MRKTHHVLVIAQGEVGDIEVFAFPMGTTEEQAIQLARQEIYLEWKIEDSKTTMREIGAYYKFEVSPMGSLRQIS